MPIMKAWGCLEPLSEISWKKHLKFDYQGGAGCDTVYDAFIQWLLLVMKGQDEIALSEDVRKSLIASVKDLRRWYEAESKYTNEDVLRERAENIAPAGANMPPTNIDGNNDSDDDEDLKGKKKEKVSLKGTKKGVYDEKREKFDTNDTSRALKSNPVMELLKVMKEYAPVLESLERNLYMIDKW